jgi:low affinity Fe/Cu permease
MEPIGLFFGSIRGKASDETVQAFVQFGCNPRSLKSLVSSHSINTGNPAEALLLRARLTYSWSMTKSPGPKESGFHVFATKAAYWVGTKWAFLVATLVIIVWVVSGPYFQYSDTWQLIINTGTTVVTFLVVFLIQNTQNRDARAIHLKLDEIIKAIDQAQNEMIDIEHLSDSELEKLAEKYERVRSECDTRHKRRESKKD